VDVFDEEILSFWKALQDNNVGYILVGDYAASFHGHRFITSRMEIWLNDTLDDRKQLRKAFVDCKMGDYPMIETMQFVPGWTEFYLNNGLRLDILINMKGLEGYSFDECLQMASIADIEGVNIPFLHINQLIQNKKTVNRLKDQVDVIRLEEIRKLKR
jgi:hypothetical protein